MLPYFCVNILEYILVNFKYFHQVLKCFAVQCYGYRIQN